VEAVADLNGPTTRAGVAALAARVAPPVPPGARRLMLDGPVGAVVPGGLPRGGIVQVTGTRGDGVTSLGLQLAAAATRVGEWVAFLDDGTLGGLAALEAGVAEERFVVVRGPGSRWASVAAMLVEGFGVVIVDPPPRLGDRDARRIGARVRERGTVLVVLGRWPAPGVRLTLPVSAARAAGAHGPGQSAPARAGAPVRVAG